MYIIYPEHYLSCTLFVLSTHYTVTRPTNYLSYLHITPLHVQHITSTIHILSPIHYIPTHYLP